MEKLLRMAFMALSLLVCSGAWADPVTVTDPYDSEWCFVIASQGPGTIKSSIDNNTFTFHNYVDRNGTRITGEINQNDVDALAGLTYPANYPTFLDLKGVSYSGDVTLTLNPIFTGLRLPFGSDLTTLPSTILFAFYSNYTKINYNDGNNESIPIYLYVKEGGMSAAISKLGDYLKYRPVYLSGTYTEEELATLQTKDGITINPSSGEGGGGGGSTVDTSTLAEKISSRAQITNVPTIYIDLPDIGNQTLGEYLYKKVGSNTTPEEAPYRPAKIQVVATSDSSSPHYLESFIEDAIDANGNTNLEIKVRGNSTALPSIPTGKRPYRLKFASKKTSTDGKAHKHDLLGYGYSKRNWVLLANLNDNSMLRNALTYEIGKSVGMPFCPGYKFVDLVINNEYRGTYQVSDHCEVDANRININEDTGWYVEFQGRPDMCDYPMCFAEGGMLMNINNPEPDDETDAEQCAAVISPIKDWFLNTWVKGFGAGFTNPSTGWRAYNDEESLIKFWIATELTGDYDGLMSVKAYREADGKLCWGPLWDKDLAFGNYSSMAAADGKLVAHLQQASCIQGYFDKLTQDPEFMTHAKAIMDNLVSGGIKDHLLAKIDEMAEIVSQTVIQNYQRWGNPQQPGAFGHVSLANHQAYVDQLKQWLSARIDYVQQRFDELVEEAHTVTGSLALDAAKSQEDNGIKVGLLDKLYDITLSNKTFEKDKWTAISLPFSVNDETLKSVFGDQYELKELAGIYSNGTTLYFATPADKAITPGMPYLIKPSKVVAANPVFNGVMLAYCPDWTNNHKAYGESVTFGNYTFSANLYLNSLNVDGTDLLIGGDAASFTFPQKANDWDKTGPVYGLNAYIRKANGAPNPTISFTPEVQEPRAQMNDVPTIYIDTDAPIDADNWGTAAIEVFDENNMIGGSFTLDNTGLSVKFVGDGSDEKKSYRLKFENKRAFLGSKSGSYKQWVLESNDDDPSMLRNGLTEELGDLIGFTFTPGCQYADLVVNGTYVGTYQITDRVKAESGRVFVIDKATDWLLEIASNGEVGANDLYVAGDDTNPNIVIKNPDKDDITAEEQAALQTAVGNYFSTFWNDIENKVDQTSFINWYVASEILGGYKQLSDIFVYKDNADGKLYFGPLWSNDKAYGNNAKHPVDMSDLNTAGSYNGMLFNHADYKVMRKKIEALWQEQWFKDAVIAKWNTIFGEAKTTDLQTALTAKIDALAAEIAQTQADNYASKENGGAGWTLEGEYASAVQTIKDYLTQRFVYLDTKFKELSAKEAVETVELIDGQPYTNTTEQFAESVTYTRSFNNTKWQAWFAPFDLVVDDYLNDFSFAKIHQINLVNDGTFTTGDKIEILYTRINSGTIYANKPYLIMAKQKGQKVFELSDVTLKSANDITPMETSTTNAVYTITGTYKDVTGTPESPFMALGGGTINWSGTGTLHSYRWYIKVNPISDPYAKPQFVIEEYDSDATGISSISKDAGTDSIYSPNGIQLEKPKKGLNIIRMKDGTTRKVLVK